MPKIEELNINTVDLVIAYNSDDPLTQTMAANELERRHSTKTDIANQMRREKFQGTKFGKEMINVG